MRPFPVSRSLIPAFILATLISPLVSVAQTPFSITGVPPYAVQIPVPLGFISATTGRLHLEIPIASIPERNGEPLIAKLVFDGTNPNFNQASAASGWALVTGTAHSGSGSYSSTSETCTAAGESGYPNGSVTTYFGFSFTDFNNTVHASTNQLVYTKQYRCYTTQGVPDPNNSGGTPTATAIAGDASGYTFNVSNYTAMQIYAPDGTLVYDTTSTGHGLETPVDTNGNYENAEQANSAPDTLGRTPFTISSSTSGCLGSGTAPATITVKVSDGSSQTYTFNCTMLNVSQGAAGNTQVGTDSFLTSITLPDNTQVQLYL